MIVPIICPINSTGSSLKIAYIKINIDPLILNNQNPRGAYFFSVCVKPLLNPWRSINMEKKNMKLQMVILI